MLKSNFLFSILLILVCGLGVFLWQQAHKPLPILSKVEQAELLNSRPAPSGSPFGVPELQNKVWVASFIFTSCQGPCPLMTAQLQKIHNEFQTQTDLQFLSITVDPETDTPLKLEDYAKNYRDPQDKGWQFLTGARDKLETFMKDELKLGFADDIMFHSDKLVLVDAQMQVRGYYSGILVGDMKKLQRDIKKVLNEHSLAKR